MTRKFQYFLLCAYFIAPHYLFYYLFDIRAIKPFDIAALFILISFIFNSNFKFRIDKAFFYLASWYFIRSIISSFEIGAESLLYGVKLYEYLVIFTAIGLQDKVAKNKLLLIIIISTIFWASLELFGYSLNIGWGDRLSAQYGGPYELGAIAIIGVILFRESKYRLISLFILLLSGAKSSILSLFSSTLIYKKKYAILGIALIVVAGIFFNEQFRGREFIISTTDLLSDNLLKIYNDVNTTENKHEYDENWNSREVYFKGSNIDLSTGSRIYTYFLIIKSISGLGWIYGNGPGYYSAAVDSSILRLLGETGLMGLILFALFMRKIFSGIGYHWLTLAVTLNMLLVDIFFSARFLCVLYLIFIMKYENKK